MSALFDLEVMQMVRKGRSEEGRKNVDVAFKFKSKTRVELTRLTLPSRHSGGFLKKNGRDGKD